MPLRPGENERTLYNAWSDGPQSHAVCADTLTFRESSVIKLSILPLRPSSVKNYEANLNTFYYISRCALDMPGHARCCAGTLACVDSTGAAQVNPNSSSGSEGKHRNGISHSLRSYRRQGKVYRRRRHDHGRIFRRGQVFPLFSDPGALETGRSFISPW